MHQQFQGFRPGEILDGRYEVIDEIGRGGFGVVYRARQIAIDRIVALKILLPEADTVDPQAVERFRREAVLISSLESPNTITLIEFGQNQMGMLYTVMEFARGETLRNIQGAEGRLSAERVVRIATQVLSSLHEAHQRGIIHRDLKPANIMVGEFAGQKDHVKVLDFGIAKILKSGDTQSTLALTGRIVGTPRYMAPEQLRGANPTAAVDLYALGLIMYECLTGAPAVKSNDAMEQVEAQMRSESFKLPQLPGVPLELVQVVNKALEKDLSKRFQSAEEFKRAIEGAMNPRAHVADPNATRVRAAVVGPQHMVTTQPGTKVQDEEEEASGGLGGFVIAAVILFLLAAGGVGYLIFTQNQGGGQQTTQNQQQTESQQQTPPPDQQQQQQQQQQVQTPQIGPPNLPPPRNPSLGTGQGAAPGTELTAVATNPTGPQGEQTPPTPDGQQGQTPAENGQQNQQAQQQTPPTPDGQQAQTQQAQQTPPTPDGQQAQNQQAQQTPPTPDGQQAQTQQEQQAQAQQAENQQAQQAQAQQEAQQQQQQQAQQQAENQQATPPENQQVALNQEQQQQQQQAETPTAATVPVEIRVEPGEVDVYLNDERVCRSAPCTVQVPSDGSTVPLRVRRSGYRTYRGEVSSENAASGLNIELRRERRDDDEPTTPGIAPL